MESLFTRPRATVSVIDARAMSVTSNAGCGSELGCLSKFDSKYPKKDGSHVEIQPHPSHYGIFGQSNWSQVFQGMFGIFLSLVILVNFTQALRVRNINQNGTP